MGGKVWTAAEERYFWRTVIPQSPKRLGVDRARPEMSWAQLARTMQIAMGEEAKRIYTSTMLFEHYFQNIESGHWSPNATSYVMSYVDRMDPVSAAASASAGRGTRNRGARGRGARGRGVRVRGGRTALSRLQSIDAAVAAAQPASPASASASASAADAARDSAAAAAAAAARPAADTMLPNPTTAGVANVPILPDFPPPSSHHRRRDTAVAGPAPRPALAAFTTSRFEVSSPSNAGDDEDDDEDDEGDDDDDDSMRGPLSPLSRGRPGVGGSRYRTVARAREPSNRPVRSVPPRAAPLAPAYEYTNPGTEYHQRGVGFYQPSDGGYFGGSGPGYLPHSPAPPAAAYHQQQQPHQYHHDHHQYYQHQHQQHQHQQHQHHQQHQQHQQQHQMAAAPVPGPLPSYDFSASLQRQLRPLLPLQPARALATTPVTASAAAPAPAHASSPVPAPLAPAPTPTTTAGRAQPQTEGSGPAAEERRRRPAEEEDDDDELFVDQEG
ncbi:hypothetical protein F4780DRAFT_786247 [Xylariomycetidae sp. FL0641]|nr:hypothetical protein F4780DRAFT_786247 [Xylariomycetidae sp. FL0641]